MTASTKLKIDRIVGGTLCFFVNLCLVMFGWCFNRKKAAPFEIKSICIAKYTGMGNIITALPLLASTKSAYPNVKLIFVTSDKNREILELASQVDTILYVSEVSIKALIISVIRLVFSLWKLRPQIFLDLEIYSYFSSLISILSGANERVGFCRRSTSLKEGFYTKLVYFNILAPKSELYLELGRKVGILTSDIPLSKLIVRPQSSKITSLPVHFLNCSNLMTVNPNASDLSLERRWPLNHFAKAVRKILETSPLTKVVLIGASGEAAYVQSLFDHLWEFPGRVFNLAGKTTLKELANVLTLSKCVLTNDSGPMHLSFLLERPTVALFGPAHPTQCSSLFNFNRSRILYSPPLCSPCIHEIDILPCKGDNICMQNITVEKVVAACLEFLEGPKFLKTKTLDVAEGDPILLQ